ncbi:hypothetical protein E2C01_086726 [Portunus trituberculatus]|uniref:Uncharacterized protein n=1 Tax=Portunus trituberculatus TaxID=210409 RepID=A0A5B7J663_PORTR|nr:hypothetical protein [Portunus trituberculatus]
MSGMIADLPTRPSSPGLGYRRPITRQSSGRLPDLPSPGPAGKTDRHLQRTSCFCSQYPNGGRTYIHTYPGRGGGSGAGREVVTGRRGIGGSLHLAPRPCFSHSFNIRTLH